MNQYELAVWGDPIAHSLSPVIHQAAYAYLGLPYRYGRLQVNEATFDEELAKINNDFRGLSLTMPLKKRAAEIADLRDMRVQLSGSANTLFFEQGSTSAFNTDVAGIIDSLHTLGVRQLESARIIGAGATASSALIAAYELGAQEVQLIARRSEAFDPLQDLAARLGLELLPVLFSDLSNTVLKDTQCTVSTLPADVIFDDEQLRILTAGGGALLDVIYAQPTQIRENWPSSDPVADGLGMLLGQALRQIRIFRYGNPDETLPNEAQVLEVMASAVSRASA